MKYILFFFLFGLDMVVSAHMIDGKIGPYPIEMEIQNADFETGHFEGKYRYANKTDYLDLKGELMQNIIWMEESYEDEVTGNFYLEMINDEIRGKWISGKKSFDVSLKVNSAIRKEFRTKSLLEYAAEVNTDISGGYATETYFLNDMWFREDNPQMEIGFNGGSLVLEEIGNDSLRFLVNTVCGPTYHIAYASGVAHRTGNQTYGCLVEAYEADSCYINIQVKEKSVHMWATGNYVCGFGARAYLDHTFTKITNRYVYDEEEVSIGVMKGLVVGEE